MDRFLKKPRLDISFEEDINSSLNESETALPYKRDKIRHYNVSYLAMGFSWTGDVNCPLPECIVCGEKLSNTAMAPAKLKRHFSTKHGDLANKNVDYFKRLKEEKTIQAVNFQSNFKESDKA